jgi:Lipocalin-like domain
MKRILSISAGFLVLVLFGCGGSSGTPSTGSTSGTGGGLTASKLIGSWKDSNISGNGSSSACPGQIPMGGGTTATCGADDLVILNSNMTYSITGNQADTGTWSLSGSNVDFVSNQGQGTYTYAMTMPSSTELMAVINFSGSTVTETLQKQ